MIESNFDAFLKVILRQSEKSDCTWQKIIMALDFEDEFIAVE
jgi:hypothetical protein